MSTGTTASSGVGTPPPVPLVIAAPFTSVQPSAAGFCLCTRRDANPAGDCPRGVGQSVTQVLGNAGGSLALLGQEGEVALFVPPTALSGPTSITLTETNIPPPAGFVDYSPAYRLEPLDQVFAEPVKVQVPISNGNGFDVADNNLAIFWSASGTASGMSDYTLSPLPASALNAGFVTGTTLRGGYFIAGYAHPGSAVACGLLK
jgi:hypothetical protein